MGGKGSGGYRRPNNPASVSGPGSMSQRTDGRTQAPKQMDSQYYGDAKDMQQIQQGAPMAATAPVPSPTAAAAQQMPQMTPFGAASQQPDVPTTDGAAVGPGAGPEALGLQQDTSQQAARQIAPLLPVMIRVANGPYGSPELKQYIRAVIAAL